MRGRAVVGGAAILVGLAVAAGYSPLRRASERAPPQKKAAAASTDGGATECAAAYASGSIQLAGSSFPGLPGDIVVADVDRDGHPDVVLASGTDESCGDVHVLFGPFNGGPSATWSSEAPNFYRRLAVGDVDGDGDLDIVVAVQPGKGGACPDAGAIHSRARRKGPLGLFPFYSKDLDCDGGIGDDGGATQGSNATLVPVPATGKTSQVVVAVFRSTGTGGRSFSASPTQTFVYRDSTGKSDSSVLAGLGAYSVDLGDFDGDGDLDIAVGGGSDATSIPVDLLANDGNGSFGQAWRSLEQIEAYSVRFLDWDGDGLIDLLATSQFGTQWGFLYKGVVAGSATRISDASTGAPLNAPLACAITPASDALRFDGGGGVVAAAVNAMQSYPDNGRPALAAIVQPENGDASLVRLPALASGVRFADVDGDGRVDLLLPLWSYAEDASEGAVAGPIYCVGDVTGAAAPQALGSEAFFSPGIGVADLDEASRQQGSFTPAPCAPGGPKRFVVPVVEPNLESVTGVSMGGAALSNGQFATAAGGRVVYLRSGFDCVHPPTIAYAYSTSPDIVVGDDSASGSSLRVFFHHPP